MYCFKIKSIPDPFGDNVLLRGDREIIGGEEDIPPISATSATIAQTGDIAEVGINRGDGLSTLGHPKRLQVRKHTDQTERFDGWKGRGARKRRRSTSTTSSGGEDSV